MQTRQETIPLTGFRLSPQQEQILRLSLGEQNVAFTAVASVMIAGEMTVENLKAATECVVGRNEILHTTFRRQPDTDRMMQVISSNHQQIGWSACDISHVEPEEQQIQIDHAFNQLRHTPFDLQNGPLLQTRCFTLAPDKHLLVLGLPALCEDGAGLQNLVRDLSNEYCARKLHQTVTEQRMQYADLSEWLFEILESERMALGREYWEKITDGDNIAIAGALPFERAGNPSQTFNPHILNLSLPQALVQKMIELTNLFQVTVADLFLTAWQIFLWRYNEGNDVVIGAGFVFMKN
jgi:NRPS condensation-like uncharacterized protein